MPRQPGSAAIALFVAVTTLAAPLVRAEDAKAAARRVFKLGDQHLQEGAYAQALAEFLEAYRLFPSDRMHFAIAQAYRLAGDADHALEHYRAYLAVVHDGAEAAEAWAQIAALERSSEEKKAQAERERVARESAEAAQRAAAQPPPIVEYARPTSRRFRTMQLAGWATAGVGGALVVVGATFAGLAPAAANEVNHPKSGYVFDPVTEDRVLTYNRVALAGLIVGGVALAAGVTVGVLGLRGARGERRALTAWTPMAPLEVSF